MFPALAFFLPFAKQVYVFRVIVFAIVLTFAAAPEAALLCKVWCQPGNASASECDHHDPSVSTIAKSADGCSAETPNVVSVVREDGRLAAGSDARHAVPLPRYWLARPLSELRTANRSERAWAFVTHPLEATLRI